MGRMIALLAALALTVSPAIAAPLNVAILPRLSAPETLSQTKPLADYLHETTGLEVAPIVTTTFADFEARVDRGEIAIGYENPVVYTRTSDKHEVLAVASRGASGPRFRGLFITRADSPVVSLEELRGKKVGFIGYTSACGYISQKLTLMSMGINPETDMQLVEALNNKAENVMLGVYYGDLDVGMIQDGDWAKDYEHIPKAQLKVIGRGEWLPNWTVSVSRSLPAAQKKAIKDALLALPEGHPALKAIDAHGFHDVTEAEFDGLRRALGTPTPR